MANKDRGNVTLRHAITASPHQPLIGVLTEQDGHEVVRYFTDDAEAPRGDSEDKDAPIKLAGAWRDLDDEDVLGELERIRHQSAPTPPLADL